MYMVLTSHLRRTSRDIVGDNVCQPESAVSHISQRSATSHIPGMSAVKKKKLQFSFYMKNKQTMAVIFLDCCHYIVKMEKENSYQDKKSYMSVKIYCIQRAIHIH